MIRLTTLVHRTIALGMLIVLLVAPTAFAQSTPNPETPGAPALIPIEQSPPAESFDPAAAAQNAPETPAPAEATAPAEAIVEPQAAGDERWDDRFGTPGVPNEITAMTRAADGTLYASVGFFESYIARWNGRSWQNIAGTIDDKVEDIAVSGNTVYVVGDFTKVGSLNANQIARWNGTAWSRVGTGAGPQIDDQFGGPAQPGRLYAVAVVGNDIFVGGDFDRMGGVPANGIARWNGTAWSALGLGVQNENTFEPLLVYGSVRTIVPSGNKLYVGGRFDLAGGSAASSLAVWNGSAWSALGGGVTDDQRVLSPAGLVLAIAVSGSNVYVGGNFDHAGGVDTKNIAHWNGSAWNALGDGATLELEDELDEVVSSILVSGSNVYIGGELEAAGDQVAISIARWNGSAWSSLNAFEDFDSVAALALGPNGGIFVGGEFTEASAYLVNNIAFWTGAAWQALGQGLTKAATGDDPGEPSAIVSDSAGRIYVGGRFSTVGGVAVSNIAMWDGSKWSALGAGVEGNNGAGDGSVEAMVIVGNELYVGGTFVKAGGASMQHLAKFNLATRQWSQVGGGVDGEVYSLAFSDGLLYVGGNFNNAGSQPINNLAVWNGAQWSKLGNTVEIYQVFDSCSEQSSYVYDITVQGSLVYIGGSFRLVYKGSGSICSVSSYLLANHVLIYDRSTGEWYTLGSGLPGVSGGTKVYAQPVSALLAFGDDLYVGGHFTKAGAVTASNIARFNLATGWSAVSGGVSGTGYDGSSSTGPEVRALVLDGTQLYVAGDFTATGGGPAKNIASYNIANGSWSTLGSGLVDPDGSTTVQSLLRGPDGLYAGGKFVKAGDKSSLGLAFWNLGPLASQNKKVFMPMLTR